MKIITLKRLRESGKRNLFVIPYFFTLANAFFGFMAVIKTFEFEFTTAAYCIVLAAIMDFFDGRLARVFHSSSYLGMELDSLSDAVSFCFAPAVLLYSWYLNESGVIGVIVLTAYLCAGLLRLAKFNILSRESASNFFVGLPTTAAAFIIAQMVTNSQWIIASPLRFMLHPTGILIVVAILAFLMVSPIPFPSFKKLKLSPILMYLVVLSIVLFVIIAVLRGIPFLFFGLLAYALSSIIVGLYVLARNLFSR